MAIELSHAMQDYLKVIFRLSTDASRVSTTRIALELSVQPASVTSMIKKLAELHLVEHQSYYGVHLTAAGRTAALGVVRHHRLLEAYLCTALGFDWADVHDEADRLEHHISEEFEDRIAALLGDPLYDPHGDPIPTKNGLLPPSPTMLLTDIAPGATITVRRVVSARRDVLQQLSAHHIAIGLTISVLTSTFDAVDVRLIGSQRRVKLPRELAKHIFVELS